MSPAPRPPALRHALDGGQYAPAAIKAYERMYGEGFTSPGGPAATTSLVPCLRLVPGARVLDAGCGLGGAALHMSAAAGACVHGVDLCVNAVLAAMGRAAAVREERATFEVADFCAADLGDGVYDAVHCRDAASHVDDKAAMFERCARERRGVGGWEGRAGGRWGRWGGARSLTWPCHPPIPLLLHPVPPCPPIFSAYSGRSSRAAACS